MLRVLVCGARDYTDMNKVWWVLDLVQENEKEPIILIEGQCPKGGADHFAALWAAKNLSINNHIKFPANWRRYGRAAGPIRNRQMLKEGKPDLVLAFGGLDGSGTNHMVMLATMAGVKVLEYDR